MSFDPDIHITHKDLAEQLGMTSRKLAGEILSFETQLERAGDASSNGEHVTYYDRAGALEWARLWAQFDATERRALGSRVAAKPKSAVPTGQIAPPRTPTPFKALQLDADTRRNFERAHQVQPPMMTPNGYGPYTRSFGGSESTR